jgi:hypothetical protein
VELGADMVPVIRLLVIKEDAVGRFYSVIEKIVTVASLINTSLFDARDICASILTFLPSDVSDAAEGYGRCESLKKYRLSTPSQKTSPKVWESCKSQRKNEICSRVVTNYILLVQAVKHTATYFRDW